MGKIGRDKLLFIVTRALIVLSIAAVLIGLYFDDWTAVLNNARILCFSCIGLE